MPDRRPDAVAAAPVPISQKPIVPGGVRALLGPSWTIEGEDPERYEELLAEVGAAVHPADILDWLLLKDIVAHTWEIQRSRQQRANVVRMGRLRAMEQILDQAIPHSEMEEEDDEDFLERHRFITSIANKWLSGDVDATEIVVGWVNRAGFSLNDVAVHALTVQANELERIDQQVQSHEARRDAALQQIERRRDGFAQRVRQASEEAVDAEFVEAPSDAEASAAASGKDSET